MKETTTSATIVPVAIIEEAWQEVGASFERFCLTAGIATLANMMEEDAARLCGPRYGRAEGKAGHRWGKTKGKVGFHGGKVEIERPRVRARDGGEVPLASWETAISEDLLGKWALNLMLINVSTRRFGRAVRLPEGDISAAKGTGATEAFSVAPSITPRGCLPPSPSMPMAASSVRSSSIWMPSIWMISRSSPDRSAAIHSAMRSADSATNRRDTADLDTPVPLAAEMSPSGSRTARPKRRDLDDQQVQPGQVGRHPFRHALRRQRHEPA